MQYSVLIPGGPLLTIWWHHLYDLHILDFEDTKLKKSFQKLYIVFHSSIPDQDLDLDLDVIYI